MPITIKAETAAEVIQLAVSGQDHRGVVVDIIDQLFVSEVVEFFGEVALAKMRRKDISLDWYRERFLNETLESSEFALNAGLNMKTIKNKRQTERREVVIEESLEHFDKFIALIDSLNDDDINIDLSLKVRGVAVQLNLNESLLVINVLAVKRAAIRGGVWSTVGKQVEGPLMETLCRLFKVDSRNFTRALAEDGSLREVDYYLLPPDGSQAKCEMKLMGMGNPESADAVVARGSRVFVASTMSDINKTQMDERDVLWTELQTRNGFLRFGETLRELGIPYSELPAKSDYTQDIERAIQATFAA